MKKLLLVGLVAMALLAGCGDDPLGATTRTRINAQSAQSIAQANAQARIEAARYDAQARETAAREDRVKAQVWAGTMPILFLLVAAGVMGALWVHWSGKTHYSVQTSRVQTAGVLAIEEKRRLALMDYATATGARMIQGPSSGSYLLQFPDGGEKLYLPKQEQLYLPRGSEQ
jgi:hypothetical protein